MSLLVQQVGHMPWRAAAVCGLISWTPHTGHTSPGETLSETRIFSAMRRTAFGERPRIAAMASAPSLRLRERVLLSEFDHGLFSFG